MQEGAGTEGLQPGEAETPPQSFDSEIEDWESRGKAMEVTQVQVTFKDRTVRLFPSVGAALKAIKEPPETVH